MNIEFAHIYEGWRNHIIPPAHLKKAIKLVSRERMMICKGCEFNSRNKKDYHSVRIDEHCTDCGCTLSAKTKCLSCCCPMDYWTSVVSKEEEDRINEK